MADVPAAHSTARIIDLTLPVRHGMRGVQIEPLNRAAIHGYNTTTLHLYSHSGTHMDAPLHFLDGDGTIDQIPLHRCCGPAVVADLSAIAPRELITVAHLGSAADKTRPHDALLLRTDWYRHVDDPATYRDGLPRISRELAQWCIDREVRLIGVEPPSVADVNSLPELTEIHQLILSHDIIIVEGLANLDQLNDDRVLFCAAPLKIEHGDGSPCRAFAIEGLSIERFHP
ncbi:MAG TPA: cyclase family protein [Planctomycetia bacterium]|nr:cyclase family protein [Planctomycetia bacterium]